MDAYLLSKKDVLESLGSKEDGLTSDNAKERLEKYGPNILKKKKGISAWVILLRQFTSFIVLILIAAMIISILIGETMDAIVIGIIVILNGVFGFVQEYRAEKAIEALKKNDCSKK